MSRECKQCGKCCQYHLLVSKKDIQTLQEVVKSGYEFPTTAEELTSQHNALDTHCPFYNMKTTKCTVHESRPLICRGYYCEECGGMDLEVMGQLQEQLQRESDPVNVSETNMSRLFRPELYALKAGTPVVATFAYKDGGQTKTQTASGTLIRFKTVTQQDHKAKFAVIALHNSGGETFSIYSELVQKIFNPDKELIRQAQKDMLEASKKS